MNLSKGQGPLLLSPGEYRIGGDLVNYGNDPDNLDGIASAGQALFVNETGPAGWVQSTGTSIVDSLITTHPKIIGIDIPFEKITLEEGEVDAAGFIPDGRLLGLRATFVRDGKIVSIGGLLTMKYDAAKDYENRTLCILPEGYRPRNPVSLGDYFYILPDGKLVSITTFKLTEFFNAPPINEYYGFSTEDIEDIEDEYTNAHTTTLIIPNFTYLTF